MGGGSGSLIGGVHRTAMRFDDRYEIVAGVLSRNPAEAWQGSEFNLPRPYATVADILRGERERRGRDGGAAKTAAATGLPVSAGRYL
jgi:hypothetical protein